LRRVTWAVPRHGGVEIENAKIERQKVVAEGVWRGETLPESPSVGSTPSDVFIIIIYNNTILTPYCNILANMMCGTIYCFPMIYCIYV
jgi:hypothetical protein